MGQKNDQVNFFNQKPICASSEVVEPKKEAEEKREKRRPSPGHLGPGKPGLKKKERGRRILAPGLD